MVLKRRISLAMAGQNNVSKTVYATPNIDNVSFGFGLLSLVCWGVAEIPQIITNFRTKSSHGVSLFFLLAWVVGDTFNLVGWLLQPATLPTQFYTAVLYTTSTVMLVLQTLYYGYFHTLQHVQGKESNQEVEDLRQPLRPLEPTESAKEWHQWRNKPQGYLLLHNKIFCRSARSMAGSMTPPIRSFMRPVKDGSSNVMIDSGYCDDDDEPNLAPPKKYLSKSIPIPRSAGYGAFLATLIDKPHGTKALVQASVGLAARKLLQEHSMGSAAAFGQWLGWIMAAIYMGIESFMFIFALAANATYVNSILVRSIAWDRLKANMPWLLDAVGCIALDLFVLCLDNFVKRDDDQQRRVDTLHRNKQLRNMHVSGQDG